MLTVETYIAKSPISGMGLFAARDIQKGEMVYAYDRLFNVVITEKDFENLHPIAKAFVKNYGTFEFNVWNMDLDNFRFVNHSNDPNISCIDENGNYYSYALKDISRDTEITLDYTTIGQSINF